MNETRARLRHSGLWLLMLSLLTGCGGGGGDGHADSNSGSSRNSGINVSQGEAIRFGAYGWSGSASANVTISGCPIAARCVLNTSRGTANAVLEIYTTTSSEPGDYVVRILIETIRQCFFGICSGGDIVSDRSYAVTVHAATHTISTSYRLFSTGSVPVSLTIADVNYDGLPDVMTANAGLRYSSNGSASVLHGQSDGSFHEIQRSHENSSVVDVVITDLNGDGLLDRALAISTARQIPGAHLVVDYGLSNGFFTESSVYRLPACRTTLFGLHADDTNGNGTLDLIVGCGLLEDSAGGAAMVLKGIGDGTFSDADAYPSGESPARSMDAGDVNGDGITDLAFIHRDETFRQVPNIVILFGDGMGGFTIDQQYVFGASDLSSIELADLNQDAVLDMVLTHDSVSILHGSGNGGFVESETLQVGYQPVATTTHDMNGDGRADLLTANQGSGSSTILINNGSGFNPIYSIAVGPSPTNIAVFDINSDGKPDQIVTHSSDQISVVLNRD